jgi:sulfur-oxidizing protein SoxA
MTMEHRIYDCFWQMRMPEVDLGSEVPVALTMYLAKTAEGGEINAPGLKR